MRTHNTYTEKDSETLNAILERILSWMTDRLTKRPLPGEVSIFLGGGYGRGEGGVFTSADGGVGLYNDLDFFVFTRRASRRERQLIDSRMCELEAELHTDPTLASGIDVDFSPAKNIGTVQRESRRLMYQELRYGHIRICGDMDLKQLIAPLPPAEIPPVEYIRLLVNRGMGLLLATEKFTQKSEDADFIRRNINKAVLGAADALLLHGACYDWSIRQREKNFTVWARNEDVSPEIMAMYKQAVEFKLHPYPVKSEDFTKPILHSACFLLACMEKCSEQKSHGDLTSVRMALHYYDDRYSAHRLKNALRWIFKTRSIGSLRMLGDEPLCRLLGEIGDFYAKVFTLANIDSSYFSTKEWEYLKKLWKIFN